MSVRLFVGLDLPESIKDRLAALEAGLPGARWVAWDNYHLTLSFVGEVDEALAREIDDGLSRLRYAPFDLRLTGLDSFGTGGKIRSIWVGVAPEPALHDLQARVVALLRRLGAPQDDRRFTPHVTLARLKQTPPDRVGRYLQDVGLFATDPFPVTEITLFRSYLSGEGSIYEPLATYPVGA